MLTFTTRDFEKLWGFKPETVQYILLQGFIETIGEKHIGRGAKREFDLENAYRVGVMAALRKMKIEFSFINQIVKGLFKVLDPAKEEDLMYHPYLSLDVPEGIDMFMDIYDNTWFELHMVKGDGEIVRKGDKLPLHDENVEKKSQSRIRYSTQISINLTDITREIKDFIDKK